MAIFTKNNFNGKNGKPLFGICRGQMRVSNLRAGKWKLMHNAVWYNKLGETVGLGDLTDDDFRNIAGGISSEDIFLTLRESDTYPPTILKRLGYDDITGINEADYSPGLEYILDYTPFIVMNGTCYMVNRSSRYMETVPDFTIITSDELRSLVLGY
jgi:hypothetical protein